MYEYRILTDEAKRSHLESQLRQAEINLFTYTSSAELARAVGDEDTAKEHDDAAAAAQSTAEGISLLLDTHDLTLVDSASAGTEPPVPDE